MNYTKILSELLYKFNHMQAPKNPERTVKTVIKITKKIYEKLNSSK